MKQSKKIEDAGKPQTGDALARRIMTDYQVQVKQEDVGQSKASKVSNYRQVFKVFLSLFIIAATAEELTKQYQTAGFNINQSLIKSNNKVNKDFNKLESNSDFWNYVNNLVLNETVQLGQKGLVTMPQYSAVVMSDLRITQRRLKIIKDPLKPFYVRWPTNNFDGTQDSYDPDFEDDTTLNLGQQVVAYKTEDTYKNLGGFSVSIPMEISNKAQFTKDLAVYRSSFFDIQTASVVVDLLFYNTEIEVFYMLILVIKKQPTNIKIFDLQLIGPVPRDSYSTNVSGILLSIIQILIFTLVVLLITFEFYEIGAYYVQKKNESKTKKNDVLPVVEKIKFKVFKEFVFSDLRLASYAVIPFQIVKNWTLMLYINQTYNKLGFQDLNFSDLKDSNSDIGQLIKKANINNQILELFRESQLISYMNCVTIVLISFRLFYSLEIRPVLAYKQVFLQMYDGIKRYLFLTTLFMLGFTLFAYFQFGAHIEQFSTITTAFFSVYLIILNDKPLISKMVTQDPSVSLVFFAFLVFVFNLVATFFIFSQVIFAYNFQRSRNKAVQKDDFQTKYQEKHWSQKFSERCKQKKTGEVENSQFEKPALNKQTTAEAIADQEDLRNNNQKELDEQPHVHFLESEQSQENQDQFSKGVDQEHGVKRESNERNQQEVEEQTNEKKKMELAILKKMDWNKSFAVQALDSDLQMTQQLTSDKQDELMVRQKERRCGMVIWATIMQAFYCSLYIALNNDRLQSNSYELHNNDIKQLIGLDMTGNFEKNKNVTFLPLDDFASLPDVEKWLTTFPYKFVNDTQRVPYKTLIDWQMTLYYLGNKLNYILMQGFLICFEVYDLKSPIQDGMQTGSKITATIIGKISKANYFFNNNAFNGVGGHCVNVDARKDAGSLTLQNLRDDQFYQNTQFLTRQVSMQIVTAEATSQIFTYSNIVWVQSEDSLLSVNYFSRSFRSAFYSSQNNGYLKMALQICFCLLFCVNSALQFKAEFDILKRYKQWKQLNVETLSDIEKTQRNQQRPEFFRTCEILFRQSSVSFLVHILITVWSEALWFTIIFKMGNITGSTDDALPIQAVVNNVRGDITNQQREQVMFLFMQRAVEVDENLIFLEVLITINLLLIMFTILQNMGQSRQMRMFFNSMWGSFLQWLSLLLVQLIILVGFVLLFITGFGYQLKEFQNLSWAVMTTYKMSINYQLAMYCNHALKVNKILVYVIWLTVVPIFVILQAMLLAIVTEQQEHYMKPNDENKINWLNSITFCRYNLRDELNKLKQQEEQAKLEMDFIGQGMRKKNVQKSDKNKNDFDRLEIQLTSYFDPNQKVIDYATTWAEEIRKEILDREDLRYQISQALNSKKEDQLSQANQNEKNDAQQRQVQNVLNFKNLRDRYLLYLQSGTQFFGLQRQMIETYIRYLEEQIIKMNMNFKTRNEMADKLYLYLARFEEPLTKKVEEIKLMKKEIMLLNQESQLLNGFKSQKEAQRILNDWVD